MIEKWFSTVELPLTFEQFKQLPQNPAYKYEYFAGRAWLTPRPKSYHGLLDLESFARPIAAVATKEEVVVRPLTDEDWPHLTWVMVSPWFARQGVGTALLDAAIRALVGQGYSELASTFLLGNESSTLWHWRAGFRCLPYPGSMRVIREQVAREGRVDAKTIPPTP